MDVSLARGRRLTDAADAAYRQARMIVYDVLPIGVPVQLTQLTPNQREVLDELADAEAELTNYRLNRRHTTITVP
jgi:hypothetical protein